MRTELAIYLATVLVGIVIAVLCAKWLRGQTSGSFWMKVVVASLVVLFVFIASFWLHPMAYGISVLFVVVGGRKLANMIAESDLGGYVLGVFCGTWLSFGVLAATYAT